MIERTPYHGVEIQLFELTPDEIQRQNCKDERTRKWAIAKWWSRKIINLFV